MKIRIVKAKSEAYWYADKIGEVFNVVDDISQSYRVRIEGGYRFVSKADVEEVIEHNSQLYRKVDRPVREGDTVLITKINGERYGNEIRKVAEVDIRYNVFTLGEEVDGYEHVELYESDDDKYFVLELIEQPVQPTTFTSAPTYAEVSELLYEATADFNEGVDELTEKYDDTLRNLSDDVITHNGKQYRKVKRKAAVGELVVVTNEKEIGDRYGKVYEVVKTYVAGVLCENFTLFHHEYETLEFVEQSGQTELDLIANLAQEVAELKKRLAGVEDCTELLGKGISTLREVITDNETDIADLEDRVDENEKDVEEVIELAVYSQTEILELDANVDEIIARINDVSEAVVPVGAIEKVIAELRELEGHAEKLCGHYEDNGIKELAQFHDGKSHAFLDAQKLLKGALRNG